MMHLHGIKNFSHYITCKTDDLALQLTTPNNTVQLTTRGNALQFPVSNATDNTLQFPVSNAIDNTLQSPVIASHANTTVHLAEQEIDQY